MKKNYTTPKLEVFGNIENLTNAFGAEQQADTLYISNGFTGTLVPGTHGSINGCIVPDGLPCIVNP